MGLGKRWLSLLIITLIAALLAACGSGTSGSGDSSAGTTEEQGNGGSSSEEEFVLTINNYYSSEQGLSQRVWIPWAKFIEEATDGRVKVDLYHNAALGGTTTVIEDVKGGVYDVGMILGVYYQDSQFYPLTIGDLPFALGDLPEGVSDSFSKAIGQFADKYADLIYKDDFVNLGVSPAPSNFLFSTKPINSIDDFKNKPMRAGTDNDIAFAQSLGATPTPVVFEELYNALAKGLIDITYTTFDIYLPYEFSDVAPYLINHPFMSTQASIILNKDFYDKLPEDLQQIFVGEIKAKWLELFEQNFKEVMALSEEIKAEIESKGGEVVTFSDDDLAEFKSRAVPVWENWKKLANEKGYPGDDMMADFIQMLAENGISIDFIE